MAPRLSDISGKLHGMTCSPRGLLVNEAQKNVIWVGLIARIRFQDDYAVIV